MNPNTSPLLITIAIVFAIIGITFGIIGDLTNRTSPATKRLYTNLAIIFSCMALGVALGTIIINTLT